jgi:hypothetical protein
MLIELFNRLLYHDFIAVPLECLKGINGVMINIDEWEHN